MGAAAIAKEPCVRGRSEEDLSSPPPAREGREVVALVMPCWGVDQPPHALAIVASLIRSSGFVPRAWDANIDFYHAVSDEDRGLWSPANTPRWDDTTFTAQIWQRYEAWLTAYLDSILAMTQPVLFAFSVTFTTREFALRAARYLKAKRPQIPILFGGVDCFPGELNARLLSAEGDSPCDIICQGEAEQALPAFLEEFEAKGDFRTSVPGFAYYREGKLIDTGSVELPTLRGQQPVPALEFFDPARYVARGSMPFYLSRGCVNKCHFCSERSNFKRFRFRRAEEAFEELLAILPWARRVTDVPTLSLSDSLLNANVRELERFAQLIIDKGIRINWGGQAYIHKRFRRSAIETLRRSGFSSVFWGVESGSQHVIDLMNKRYKHQEAERILRDCDELGIYQYVPIIVGYPGERPCDVVDTLELMARCYAMSHCDTLTPGLLVVRPNSTLHRDYPEHGLADNRYYDWSTVDQQNTLPVRIVRRYLASQMHGNRELSSDALVDTEEHHAIHFDNGAVSRDLFETLHVIHQRHDTLEAFYATLMARGLAQFDCPISVTGGEQEVKEGYLELWNLLHKNTSAGRAWLNELILESLRKLRASVWRQARAAPQPAGELSATA